MVMEFISAEDFSKQPKEVQEIFLDWWKPSIGDLFNLNTIIQEEDVYNGIPCDIHQDYLTVIDDNTLSYGEDFVKYGLDGEVTPLFTEGQLRKFIEDKTNGKVESYYAWDYYTIAIRDTECGGDDPQYDTEETDLLQALWKVACEIAKENI